MAAEPENAELQGPTTGQGADSSDTLERELRVTDWLQGDQKQKLQLLGVVQILAGAVTIPITVSYACLDWNCNIALAMPLWSGISCLISGFLTLALQCGPWAAVKKLRALMVLNLLNLVLAICTVLLFSLQVAKVQGLFSPCQQRGVLVLKATAISLTGLSLLTSLLTLLLLGFRKSVHPMMVHTRYQKLLEDDEDCKAADVKSPEVKREHTKDPKGRASGLAPHPPRVETEETV